MSKTFRARRDIIVFLGENGNQPFSKILQYLNGELRDGTISQALGVILHKMPEVERKGDCGREDPQYYRGNSVQGMWGLKNEGT